MNKNYKFIPITKNEAESRLDRVIHKLYPYLNQACIEKALRSKFITVNQQKTKSNYRLNLGDHLQISDHLIEENYSTNKNKKHVSVKEQHSLLDWMHFLFSEMIPVDCRQYLEAPLLSYLMKLQ